MGSMQTCLSKTQQQDTSQDSKETSNLESDQPPVLPNTRKQRKRYVSKGSSGEHPGSTPDMSSDNQSPPAVSQGHTYDTAQNDRQFDNMLKQFGEMLTIQKRMEDEQKKTDERLRIIELHLEIVTPDNSSK